MTIAAIQSSKTHKYINFMLLTPRLFLQLIHQQTNALNKIQFLTNIDLLHVLTLGCHPQVVVQIIDIFSQHANLGDYSPHWDD